MKFTVKGVPGLPIALLIHPALTDASFFDDTINALGGRYRVAVPTLDGHYDGSPDFLDAERSATELAHHLRAEGIDHVNLLFGCQLGAVVGLRLLADLPRGAIRRAVFDGAPLAHSEFGRGMYLRELRRIAKAAHEKAPGKARNLVDSRDEEYAHLVVQTVRGASDVTLQNVARACNDTADLPDLPEVTQGFTTFYWGSFDQTMKCATRVGRAYPRAHVVIKRGYPALGYLLKDPEAYAEEFLL